MKITITQAAKQFGIPRSRVVRAVKNKLIKTTLVNGKHEIEEDDLSALMGTHYIVEREDRRVLMAVRKDLCQTCRESKKFATTAAASQFEKLAIAQRVH